MEQYTCKFSYYEVKYIYIKKREVISMKVYDKEIYSKQESLKTIIIFIIVFLLGFFAGYMAHSFNETHQPQNTNNTYIVENK